MENQFTGGNYWGEGKGKQEKGIEKLDVNSPCERLEFAEVKNSPRNNFHFEDGKRKNFHSVD